ncbi:MAG: hypothetical protein MR481_07565 [Campylobacter sp.]|uniref:hypothetical protein n=1 Tax=Campylobacter sp. TaxID=205 RepID=UPI002AA5F8A1|nr:hypothetical protein [Campylobacter sp.]MCI7247756.1 hypothetical protein [Campylobacter sp.]
MSLEILEFLRIKKKTSLGILEFLKKAVLKNQQNQAQPAKQPQNSRQSELERMRNETLCST